MGLERRRVLKVHAGVAVHFGSSLQRRKHDFLKQNTRMCKENAKYNPTKYNLTIESSLSQHLYSIFFAESWLLEF